MHYLHKILVYIPDVTDTAAGELDKDILLEAIRAYAESETACFYERVFDWRETDSAGRWSGVYPRQVYLAVDDVDWFTEELHQAMDSQRADIDLCYEQIKNTVGDSLQSIIDGVWSLEDNEGEAGGFSFMTPYYLHAISSHLYGEYRTDSYFYNTHDYTAKVRRSDFEEVKQEPENWALVMFDYHN